MKIKIYSIITFLFLSISIVAQIDRTKMPASGPAPKIHFGTPKKFTLKNGLQVLVVENKKLPKASASLTIDNPPMTYGNKSGVQSFVGSMLGTGTTNISKENFDEEIDFLGASISFGANSASGSSLSKYFPRILDLLADAVFNPVFSQDEFDKQVKQALDGIKSNEKNVPAIARQVDRVLSFGKNHPFGEITTETTIKNISLQDVKDLYTKNFKPNNAYLIIVGDVVFDEVKKQVTKLFGGWEKGVVTTPKLPEINNPETTEINFIDMPNAVQSELAIVNNVDLKLDSKDYYAALLANQILGGGGTGRLYKNLREDKGYTYGAYSGISPSRYASRFKMSASVRNSVTDSAVVEAMKEINKIRYQKVSQKELDIAKAKYLGGFVRAVEAPGSVAGYALRILQNNLPEDYFEKYLENINAVTLEDVQNAAIKYFRGDKAKIIITGKAIDVLKNLEKTDYPIKYFDKEGNPTKKPEMTTPIPEGVTASSVVDAYIEAIGGKDKVASVTSLVLTSTGKVQGIDLTLTQKAVAPNKSLILVEGMGKTLQKVMFDGNTGYQEAQGFKKEMNAKEIAEAKNTSAPFSDLAYKNGTLTRIEPVNGKKAYVIQYEDSEIFYDTASGLKIKEIKIVKDPQGKQIKLPTVYSNYKVVDGIKFPHTMAQKMGPMNVTLELKKVQINKGVSNADFK